MLLVDNTNKLEQLIEFKEGTYYKFVALIRHKDYSSDNEQVLKCMEKQEILVKDWFIDSQEMLDKTLPDMLTVAELFKCRLYMCTDRKSIVKTLLQMRTNVDTYLDPFIGNSNASCSVRAIRKIGSSASNKDESSDKDGRRWMFDVDTKDVGVLNNITNYCGDNLLAILETKQGFHIVAKKKFRAVIPSEYVNVVDVKNNAMCLIAMGK